MISNNPKLINGGETGKPMFMSNYFYFITKAAAIIYCSFLPFFIQAQTSVQVARDTVRVMNGELVINNATKNVKGFLYNVGNGVTQFKTVPVPVDTLWKSMDTLYYRKDNLTQSVPFPPAGIADPGSNGILVRTASGVSAARTLTGTSGNIIVTNGDGVSGNPTFDIGSNVVTLNGSQTLTGKIISGTNNTITNISNAMLANSTIGFALGKSGTAPYWSSSSAALGTIDTLNLPDAASGVTQGLVNNTAQSFDGMKTFNSALNAIAGFQTSIVTANSNWSMVPSTATTTNLSALLIGSGTNVAWRRLARGSTAYTSQPGYDYGATIFGTEVVNIASSGTSSIFANVAINPMLIGASSGSGTVTNSASLFIKGASAGAVNNYSFWSAAGNIRLDLGSDATGDLLYRSSSQAGALARLPIGTGSQFLGISGGIPAWLNIADNINPLRTVDAVSGTTYTLSFTDRDKTKTFTGSTATAVTIPANSSVAIPVNTEFEFVQYGTGELSIVAGSGVTLLSPGNKLKASQQYGSVKIKKTATDTWLLSGDLKL